MESMRSKLKHARDELQNDTAAAFNVGSSLTLASIVVIAVVSLIVLAALAPVYFSSIAGLSENFSTADLGDDTANSLANSIFPLIISLGGLFAIASLAFAAYKMR